MLKLTPCIPSPRTSPAVSLLLCRSYCAVPANLPRVSTVTFFDADRFRNARYDFVEQPESPKSGEKVKVVGGPAGGKATRGDRGTHEPIQEMPSTLGLLLQVRC